MLLVIECYRAYMVLFSQSGLQEEKISSIKRETLAFGTIREHYLSFHSHWSK